MYKRFGVDEVVDSHLTIQPLKTRECREGLVLFLRDAVEDNKLLLLLLSFFFDKIIPPLRWSKFPTLPSYFLISSK
jgi:hypothetical protein